MSTAPKSMIERNGTDRIILPHDMSHDDAISRLNADKEIKNYGEKEVKVEETIHRFPYEAAYALAKAINELHGQAIGHDIITPMSVIESKLIGVQVSPTETAQVPWGPFHLPDVEGELQTQTVYENGTAAMLLTAKIKRKYQEKIKRLAERAREIADRESIYRGKAISIKFRNKKGELEITPPTFMNLSGEHKVIFSEEVMREVNRNILIPIRRAKLAKEMKIPAKRGALLCGTYGCGKTLTAHWLAKESIAAGRTFIYIKDASELGDALRFATLYGPALVFAEDIDRVMFGSRTIEMDAVLNTVDGVDTKNSDTITVLTTNNLEMIHPAFLREGRMDSIIQIDEPDQNAIEGLVRLFGDRFIAPDARLQRLTSTMAQEKRTPCFVREVVEKSKLDKLENLEGENIESIQISAQDLELAFHRHKQERVGVQRAMREMERLHMVMQQFERMSGGRVAVIPAGGGPEEPGQ